MECLPKDSGELLWLRVHLEKIHPLGQEHPLVSPGVLRAWTWGSLAAVGAPLQCVVAPGSPGNGLGGDPCVFWLDTPSLTSASSWGITGADPKGFPVPQPSSRTCSTFLRWGFTSTAAPLLTQMGLSPFLRIAPG